MNDKTKIQDLNGRVLHTIGMAENLTATAMIQFRASCENGGSAVDLEAVACQSADLLEMLLEIGELSADLVQQATETGGEA